MSKTRKHRKHKKHRTIKRHHHDKEIIVPNSTPLQIRKISNKYKNN